MPHRWKCPGLRLRFVGSTARSRGCLRRLAIAHSGSPDQPAKGKSMNSGASVSQEVITVADLAFAIARVAEAMDIAAAELNAADGALGDGDIGITVSRGFAEAAAAEFPQDLGGVLVACAKAFQRVSSSSYGTL